MISLKKYLEMDPLQALTDRPASAALLAAVLESYRSALVAIGKSGARACPAVGSDLLQSLDALNHRLDDHLTPSLVRKTEAQVEEQLQSWGSRTSEHFKAKANEVKELLIILARTAESLGERDHRYTNQFSQFTDRLHTIADLDDLTQVRTSLVEGAKELKDYVDQMTQDSHNSLSQLKAEVSAYETKLKAVEELALRDPLTGLANRRNIEERMEWRILEKHVFCVVVLDLNGFKKVNDTFGHLAGDNLLKQFAQELRSNTRNTDVVGRWGGDEFIIVLDCDLAGGQIQVERMRKWVFGEYLIEPATGAEKVKIKIDAAIGLAQWHSGDCIEDMIRRADLAMYEQKGHTHAH